METKFDSREVWKIKYGRGLLKGRCSGCGFKTRRWVHHDLVCYNHTNGGRGVRLTRLSAQWHADCHRDFCRHDFCMQQRMNLYADRFGERIAQVVKMLGDMIKTEDVPKFLSSPHPELNGLSPIYIIWRHDEWGLNRVERIIEGVASGSFI